DGLACDELAAWDSRDAWDQAQFALRGGRNPRNVVATKPPHKELIRELVARAGIDVHLTTGTTFDNQANLPPGFLTNMIDRYDGTRTGRQHTYAELPVDVAG